MNTLKINGTTIPGIYVDAAVSFNKPAKRVQTFEVPGRNGDLIIDEGTFDNVLISYPVYEKDTFPAEFDELVNWLASLEGYQRIECSNDPGHYRLGRFVVPQTPTAKRLNRDGYYTLTFDCKPQRFLTSGEQDTEIAANPLQTHTGEIATFNASPLDEISDLTLDITPVQSGSGDPSPNNIRAINGWTEGHIGIANENILKYRSDIAFPTDNNGITYAQGTDGKIKISGTASANSFFNLTAANTGRYRFVPGQTYCFKLFDAPTGVNLQLYIDGSSVTYSSNFTHTFPAEFSTAYVRIRVANGTAITTPVEVGPMISIGSTEPNTYIQCDASFLSFAWNDSAGTVYGGTLDAITGKLKVTHQMVDMGAINWVYQSSYAYFWPFSATYETPSTDMLSSAYKVSSTEKSSTQMGSAANYTIAKALGDTIVMVKNTDYTDASAFKTAMSGVQLLIPLATPTEYTLTGQDVALLTGVNNIWGDTGDISVTVTEATNFINPGNFVSKPLIRVYGVGNFRVGDIYITITSHSQPYIDIDCELQDCYCGSTNMNDKVSFSSGEFPELAPGNNYVLLGTGITKLEVTPRWWEL